jgi:predicted dehydrogenase
MHARLERGSMPMSTPLGVAILGCGYWGVNHVRVLSELPSTRIVAVCDERADRLEEIERRFPHIRTATKVADTLAADGVDAVIVATQARTHFSLTSECLAAGKHVLVEKPLTTTTEDAEKLIEQADAKGLVLMVGHTFLYNHAVEKVKEYFTNDALGTVYYLYGRRTNLGPIRHDVNAVWDLASHDVAIFNHFLDGVPEWVSAVGAKVLRNSREDVGFVSLGYPNGVLGHLHASWADPNKVREVVVVGSERRILFNDVDSVEHVRVFEKGVTTNGEPYGYGEHQLLMRDGDIVSPKIPIGEPLKNQCMHFVDCVIEGKRPLTDGHVGRDVVRVMQAIDRSMHQRGVPVEVL